MRRRFLATAAILGDAVRQGRAEEGWTQAELAERAGVDAGLVAGIEAETPTGQLAEVLAVLESLGIHATALPPPPPTTARAADIDLDAHLARYRAASLA